MKEKKEYRTKWFRKEYRTKWFSFYTGWSGFHISYDLAGYFDPRPQLILYIIWGKLFLYLPWRHLHPNPYLTDEEKKNMERKTILDSILGKKTETHIEKVPYDECDPPRYGVYYADRCFWFSHGIETKCIHLPWEMDWVRTSTLRKHGEWEHETKLPNLGNRDSKNFWDKDKWNDILFMETHSYQYTTKNGTIQNVQATIRIEEREWRWRKFKWLKWINSISKSIEIDFSDDIGEKKGSWKGGTVGCGYELLPNETPFECLKRMERERKF